MSELNQLNQLNQLNRSSAAPSRRVRRTSAVGVAFAAVLLGLPLLATSATAAPKVDPALVGLYGTADPSYDGVFRQSLGILGIVAAGDRPADDAVRWLLDQQCSDGGFMAFNPDPSGSCVAADPVNFSGEDTNSAALASQALAAVGHKAEAESALGFLTDARNKDGGWPYIPGGDSDLNSTGLVLMARSTDGAAVDPDAVDYVASFQVDCSGAGKDQGGIASPYSGGAPDLLSTVQAVPGVAGLSLADGPAATASWADEVPAFTCPVDNSAADTVAGWGSAWLETQVTANAVSGGNSGWAVLSFAATRTGHVAAESLYATMVSDLGPAPASKFSTQRSSGRSASAAQSKESPGALGLAAVAGATLGKDVSDFSARIAATMTTPAAQPTPKPTTSTSPAPAERSSDPGLPDTGATNPLVILGGIALVGSGAVLIAATRRRHNGEATGA